MIGDKTSSQRTELWRSAPEDKWHDWRWQMSRRLTTVDDLTMLFPDGIDNAGSLASCIERFRMAITPYFAGLIAERGPHSPLWKQAIPAAAELEEHSNLRRDPLDEERDSPTERLIHRYPDRALILLTDRCAVYCRHCNRRRLANGPERDASRAQLDRCLAYLKCHPEVREVILSGGDPFTWSDARLDDLLGQLRKISSVDVIRIGTRLPVVLPFRVTDDLCRVLRKHHPLYVNIHVNHSMELTPEMEEACERLIVAGVPLSSQTVLLKGINDDPLTLQSLFRRLLTFRIRPYCLYHCDPVQGIAHFRTSIARGRALMEFLMATTSGLAVPSYIVDAPGGAGKIPIVQDYVESTFPGGVILRSLKGQRVPYADDGAAGGIAVRGQAS